MNRDKYVELYKARSGSTKNASKSYNRYSDGVSKQYNQANRQTSFRINELKAQKKRGVK